VARTFNIWPNAIGLFSHWTPIGTMDKVEAVLEDDAKSILAMFFGMTQAYKFAIPPTSPPDELTDFWVQGLQRWPGQALPFPASNITIGLSDGVTFTLNGTWSVGPPNPLDPGQTGPYIEKETKIVFTPQILGYLAHPNFQAFVQCASGQDVEVGRFNVRLSRDRPLGRRKTLARHVGLGQRRR
jgi:hypothetical protein